jgi:hypothetical protein
MKTLAKAAKIAGYVGSALFIGAAIYWFTIPGGWVIGMWFLVAGLVIGVETRRVIRS